MLVKSVYVALKAYKNEGVRTMFSSSIALGLASDSCHLFKEDQLLEIMQGKFDYIQKSRRMELQSKLLNYFWKMSSIKMP
jgi:hypothetical protein